MKWREHPESEKRVIELMADNSPDRIADILQREYPDETITQVGVERKIDRLRRHMRERGIPCKKVIGDPVKKVLQWLNRAPLSVGELSRRLDRSKETVVRIVQELRDKGYDVELGRDTKQVALHKTRIRKFEPLKLERIFRRHLKVLLVSDTHFGSRFQQPTLLRTAYEVATREKADFAIHCGDVTDGIRMYRGHEFELFLQGADEQRSYVIEHFPKAPFKTYMVSGNHDLSYKKATGHTIVEAICKEREDLVYRGDIGARIEFKNCAAETIHPSGGVPYSRSWRLQRMIEATVGDFILHARNAPEDMAGMAHLYLSGHLHQAFYLPYLGFHGFLVPCFQAVTPYLRAKGLFPTVGFWIITVHFDDEDNVTGLDQTLYDWTHLARENDY